MQNRRDLNAAFFNCFFAAFVWIACSAFDPAAAYQEASTADAAQEGPPGLPVGKHRFEFSGWDGPKINVWTYRPEDADENTPIVFVMHGNRRNADTYRDQWEAWANRYDLIIIAPEFSRKKFSGSRLYNLGGVYTDGGHGRKGRRQEAKWTFSAIEPLFDDVRRRTGTAAETYYLYGHSAGSQFVHRYMYFKPGARVEMAVAANAGWYTLPSVVAEYPYGLGGTFLGEADIKTTLGKNIIVLLGTDDNDPEAAALRRNAQADAQGLHRLARGETFFEAGRMTAEVYGVPFSWRLEYAPGVAHSNRGMSEFAAPLIAKHAGARHAGSGGLDSSGAKD